MVLESLFPVKSIIRKPLNMLIFSAIICFICVFIGYFVFPEYAGVIIPLFITIVMTPLLYRIFTIEEDVERKEAEHKIDRTFMQRHDETIMIFTFFFIGNFISIFLISLLFPESFVTSVFKPQFDTIQQIASVSTAAVFPPMLNIIVYNNLRVMILAFFLSFLIGTGALFILSWNASILAIYLAGFIRQGLYTEFLSKTFGILPHAPIEILAYFLAGIAGGILSVGIIRENIGSKEFFLVFKDSLIMLLLGVVAVILGGFVEVYL
jgi:uncharacterized membrane protein SpoIIM required for sporulation